MRRVLIIGATSAIATEVARIEAARGARLYLIARNGSRLARLADELGDSVVGTDAGEFSDPDKNRARTDRAAAALGGIDLALIAHGSLGDQIRSEQEIKEAHEIIDCNFLSNLGFLMPLADLLERQRGGTLAVLSSVAAERGRPRNFTYAAGKAAINVYMQGLRSRLWPSGARVCIVKLGPVETPMTVDHEKNPLFGTPGPVARSIVRAIDRGRSEVYVPGYWRPIMAVVRHLPEAVFQRLGFLSAR